MTKIPYQPMVPEHAFLRHLINYAFMLVSSQDLCAWTNSLPSRFNDLSKAFCSSVPLYNSLTVDSLDQLLYFLL